MKNPSAVAAMVRADLRAARDFVRTRWLVVILLALSITFLTCRFSPSLSYLEFTMLDTLFRWRGPVAPDPRVVLVGIERSAIDEYLHDPRREPNCGCDTLSRAEIGELVTRIRTAGARVVVLDMYLTNPCPVKGHDERLREAICVGPSEVVLAIEANPTPDKLYYRLPSNAVCGQPADRIIASPVMYNPHGVIRSVQLVQTGEISEPDKGGPLIEGGEHFPALAAAAYAVVQGQPCEIPTEVSATLVICGSQAFPVWPDERIDLLDPLRRPHKTKSNYAMLINWVGPTGSFPMYSASEVLDADPKTNRRWFEGKAVLVGSAIERKFTPVAGRSRHVSPPFVDQSAETTMSGLEIHANVLHTMLSGRFIRSVPYPMTWVVLCVCLFLTIVAFRSMSTAGALTWLLAESLGLLIAARILIAYDRWFFAVIPIAAMLPTAAASAVWGYAKATREQVALRRQLNAIDSATSTTVHDLKQPLAAINALAAALRQLQEKGRVSDAPEILQRIQNQVDSALGNINDLLLADPDRSIRLNAQVFDIAAVARDLATTHGLTSPVHTLSVHSPDGEVLVEGDPQLLGRVLSNLIENAIKYSPNGGEVSIDLVPSHHTTTIRVRDHGIGIPPDRLHAVFERFERALPDGADIPGTGVGLYSVRRLVEAHHGRVDVTSELGVGSTFTVTLPSRLPPDDRAPMR